MTAISPIALALVKRGIVEKLASNPQSAPALQADGVDAAIDPADLVRDDAERPVGQQSTNYGLGRKGSSSAHPLVFREPNGWLGRFPKFF